MTWRRTLVAVAVLGLLAALALSPLGESPPVTIEVLEPPARTLADLVERADAVVVARVTAVEDGRLLSAPEDTARVVRTQLAALAVDEVTAGEAPEQLVLEEVVALGDGSPAWVGGLRPAQVGDAGLYLLVRGEEPDRFGLLGGQGRLLLDASGAAFARPEGGDPLLAELAAMAPRELRSLIDRWARRRHHRPLDWWGMDHARQMWERGSYAIVGDWFAEASRTCLDGLDLAGVRLLDVACGTGAVAIEAARRGAAVVGVDLTPSMLEEAARRGEGTGLAVDWREGSFTDLSAYRGFDVVTSAFGLIFAEDQGAVAGEVLATLRPDGLARIAAWSRDGAFGMASGMRDLLPGMAAGPEPHLWSTVEGLSAILAQVDVALEHQILGITDDDLTIPFASVEDAVQQMRRWSGPWMVLFDALDGMGVADEGHAALVDHLSGYAQPVEDGVVITVDYSVATVVRT